jgi:hypothetical protein
MADDPQSLTVRPGDVKARGGATMRIDRADLYERVWQQPMKTLAPTFGISDVALRKICVKADIPVPERGHWAKLQAGKRTIKVRLPLRSPGMSPIVSIGESRYSGGSLTADELLGPVPDPPTFEETLKELSVRIEAALPKIRLAKSLDAPYPAIAKLLQTDEERRVKQAAMRFPSSWDTPLFDGPFERRRLRILNSIFLATAKLGGKASIGRDGCDVSISFHGTHVNIGVDLPTNLTKDPRYGSLVKGESGSKMKLIIKDGWGTKERYAWEDVGVVRLEAHLADIASKIVLTAEIQLREHQLTQHQWQIERRERLLQEQHEARETEERQRREALERHRKAQIDELLGHATALSQADLIRGLVERTRAAVDLNRTEVEDWASWALSVADELDPVRSGRLLKVVNNVRVSK